MTDPWIAILTAIEPEYKKLAAMPVKEPTIKPRIWKSNRGWFVSLEEVWPDEVIEVDNADMLDNRIRWASAQLATWPACSRQAYDMWLFKQKLDAEKFITIFSIQWPN
jgi:hypothetical protein